jgi:ACT domain-containing protein
MFVDIEKSKKDFKSIKDALEQKAKELEVSIKIQHEDIFKSMHEV